MNGAIPRGFEAYFWVLMEGGKRVERVDGGSVFLMESNFDLFCLLKVICFLLSANGKSTSTHQFGRIFFTFSKHPTSKIQVFSCVATYLPIEVASHSNVSLFVEKIARSRYQSVVFVPGAGCPTSQ